MAFNQDEINLINSQRKKEQELPKYFSATSKSNVTITRRFEDYLILQTPTQKQKILDWTDKALEIQKINIDRDTLLDTFLTNRISDNKEIINELDQEIQGFTDFIKQIFVNGDYRFNDVVEVGLMLKSLQNPLDELLLRRDTAFQETNLAVVIQERVKDSLETNDTRKELQSWKQVLSAYEGRAQGPTEERVDPGLGNTRIA
jgi:hypothetical protein